MAGKQANKLHRIRIDGVLYPYSDATQNVTIQRELIDIWKGQPGVATHCMNAECIVRNQKAFPHRVLAASVVKSRVYILDSMDHAVRYTLTQAESAKIAKHDVDALSQPGTLVLRAPKSYEAAGKTNARGTKRLTTKQSPKRGAGELSKGLARGEKARLVAAVGAAN